MLTTKKNSGNSVRVWKRYVLTPDTKGLWNGEYSNRMLYLQPVHVWQINRSCQDKSTMYGSELAEWVSLTTGCYGGGVRHQREHSMCGNVLARHWWPPNVLHMISNHATLARVNWQTRLWLVNSKHRCGDWNTLQTRNKYPRKLVNMSIFRLGHR